MKVWVVSTVPSTENGAQSGMMRLQISRDPQDKVRRGGCEWGHGGRVQMASAGYSQSPFFQIPCLQISSLTKCTCNPKSIYLHTFTVMVDVSTAKVLSHLVQLFPMSSARRFLFHKNVSYVIGLVPCSWILVHFGSDFLFRMALCTALKGCLVPWAHGRWNRCASQRKHGSDEWPLDLSYAVEYEFSGSESTVYVT